LILTYDEHDLIAVRIRTRETRPP